MITLHVVGILQAFFHAFLEDRVGIFLRYIEFFLPNPWVFLGLAWVFLEICWVLQKLIDFFGKIVRFWCFFMLKINFTSTYIVYQAFWAIKLTIRWSFWPQILKNPPVAWVFGQKSAWVFLWLEFFSPWVFSKPWKKSLL